MSTPNQSKTRTIGRGRVGRHLAACVTELQGTARSEVQLLPGGEFRANDGRPQDVQAWRLDGETAEAIAGRIADRQTPVVIDYDHQTLRAMTNGQPAPAAGWFSRVEWRDGDGLYAVDVDWTDAARARIEAGEYRYISPVFTYDGNTGRVRDLLHASLTNVPAIDDIEAVAAAQLHHVEGENMDPEIAEKLGLARDATRDQVVQAVSDLISRANDAESKVAAASSQPDPSQFVPVQQVEDLKAELASVKAQQIEREVTDAVTAALNDGRLLPTQEEWARTLGRQNMAALQQYLQSTPPIAALQGQQTGGQAPTDTQSGSGLSEAELAVCTQLGLDPQTYAKNKEG